MLKKVDQPSVKEIISSNYLSLSNQVIPAVQKKPVNKYFFIITGFAIGIVLLFFCLPAKQITVINQFIGQENYLFLWMLLVGFLAEMVAGSMGMGYGVICTTILLILNIPAPVISASIHSAESFTSAAGTISHWKLGNLNKKLIKSLAIPAIIGAVIGAIALTYLGERYAKITKPFIALYTMYLGYTILKNAFLKKNINNGNKKVNVTSIGLIGGCIDSFGGGGWGPLVTGTFIKNGHTPRYVIGSSTAAKCILTIASAITFIISIGIHHWNIVAGLLIGGIVTAPFSALLTARLPKNKMFVAVGLVVMFCSLITLFRAIFL
ncbi:MAG: sulfite exporter TauE/SafE family protein [Ferruginibacter sp.]|nr:sulfite exporter TauE/SafE family protein [Ferruginibacter sp.]